MIKASEMIRVTRKGGSVTHLALTSDVPTVCGRVALFGPDSPEKRLCKTCARIARVADSEGDWTEAERKFIELPRESGVWEMLADVVSDYEQGHPNDPRRIALYRAALAHRNYATTVITNHSDARMPSKGGNTMGYGKEKRGILTENQKNALIRMDAFLMSLTRQILELQGKESAAIEPVGEEFFSILTTREKINKAFDGYSRQIDKLKAELAELQANARKAEAKANPAEDGYYVMDDLFICVKWNRAKTGQYATVWNGESESWEYDSQESRAIMSQVRAGKLRKMLPEDAKRFGDLYGVCFRCHRTLTDPESIAMGYGPICAGKMGW